LVETTESDVIARCEYCGESFECARTPYYAHKKPTQRFCSAGCRYEFYKDERKQAMAAWRKRKVEFAGDLESFEQTTDELRKRA
jgi:hypothetical protein